MAEYLVQDIVFINIADAIRQKTGKTNTLTPSQMVDEIQNLAGLNFTVIGGTSQPASPSENTIWIETETEISEFTIMPENQIPTNPVEGMVWVVNSNASIGNFDVLNVNSLWLYPTEARQYISGQWITKALQIYKNGEWIDLFPTIATIAVTYTEGFVCMCSNGEVTFVAPDTSGYYVFPIPTMGTWTISCPDERFVEPKNVVINTEGQSENISVLYFPATITVTYPESTLTVTNGARNFTHSGGGTVTFNVDQAGNWSVSVPNTENIHYVGNTTVNISVSGENKSVTITKFTATIKVTYKIGTCTCVCGSTSYSHSGGGTATFTVNKAGTWTVKAVNGSYSTSQNVSITTTGESKNITLKYTLILWQSGNNNTAVTGGWTINTGYGAHAFVNNTTFQLSTPNPENGYQLGACTANNKFDFTTLKQTFSKLNVTMSGSATYATWGLIDDRHYAYSNYFHIAKVTGAVGTTSLNLANISGSHYLGFRSDAGKVTYVSKIWFEG